MYPSIIQKISNEITSGLRTEAQIVYVLTLIRKSLEHGNLALENAISLKFYCDWALHIKMDKAASQRILNRLEPIYIYLDSHESLDNLPEELDLELNRFMSFGQLREALDEFFQNTALTNSIVASPANWYAFIQFYSRIIEDCPLVLRQENPRARLVSAVVNISHREPEGIPASKRYIHTLHWKFSGHDSQEGVLNNHFILDPQYLI